MLSDVYVKPSASFHARLWLQCVATFEQVCVSPSLPATINCALNLCDFVSEPRLSCAALSRVRSHPTQGGCQIFRRTLVIYARHRSRCQTEMAATLHGGPGDRTVRQFFTIGVLKSDFGPLRSCKGLGEQRGQHRTRKVPQKCAFSVVMAETKNVTSPFVLTQYSCSNSIT